MTRHIGPVLVDTNVIIECWRAGAWKALAGGYEIETVETCFIETQTGAQRRRPEQQIDPDVLKATITHRHPVSQDQLAIALTADTEIAFLDAGGGTHVVRANLKGVNTVRKKLAAGTVVLYYYHRATDRRLNGPPGSPEFVRDYADAEQSQVQKLKGTLVGLIRDYTLSPEFKKRAESTQKEYRRMLTRVEAEFGDMPLAALEDPRVRGDFLKWRSEVASSSGEREADNRLSVVSAMLTWGVDNGRVFSNHVTGFKRLHKSDRSDKLWLPEHIKAFMNVAPIEMQRALILALHTGQRQGDLRKLVWTNYDGRAISLRQNKGSQRVTVRCTVTLMRMLDGMPRSSAVVLATKTGKPWSERYFKAQWEAASKAAGIDDLHFHDLRGTAVTMLAQAGCTVPEIASITGHTLKSVHGILEKYLARTGALASAAIEKFENAMSTDFANRLQTKDRSGGQTAAKSLK